MNKSFQKIALLSVSLNMIKAFDAKLYFLKYPYATQLTCNTNKNAQNIESMHKYLLPGGTNCLHNVKMYANKFVVHAKFQETVQFYTPIFSFIYLNPVFFIGWECFFCLSQSIS